MSSIRQQCRQADETDLLFDGDLHHARDGYVTPEVAIEKKVGLIGLSALMTTTVTAMKRTIDALHEAGHPCETVVGGAVLTEDYAKEIGADHYAGDARSIVEIARRVLG